jgi:hypothetical protein
MGYRYRRYYPKKRRKQSAPPMTKQQLADERNGRIAQLAKKPLATLRSYIDPNSDIRRLDTEIALEQARHAEAVSALEKERDLRAAARTKALHDQERFADVVAYRPERNQQVSECRKLAEQKTFWGNPTEQAKKAQVWLEWFDRQTAALSKELAEAIADIWQQERARCAEEAARFSSPRKRPAIPWGVLNLVPDAIAIREKEEGLRAAAARNADEQRTIADSLRLKLRKDHPCPYCGCDLGTSPHADHIYPVSKGGRSTFENMVYICAACNINKGSRTLRAFAKELNYSFELIEVRLTDLRKEF